jgi:two-component system, cell cycle sensor histidine kinase and response regulator CckA
MGILERLRALKEKLITTKRRRTEAALREAEEKYRILVEHANDAIAILQHGRTIYRNPAYTQLIGYTVADTMGRSFLDIVVPEDRDRVWEYYQKRLRGEVVPAQYEVRLLTQDSRRVSMEVKPCVIEYQGQPASMVVMRDITERKRAEEELRESEERFRKLSEAANEGIAIHEQGRILEANQTLAEMYGYELPEVIGRHALEFAAPESHDRILYNILSGYERPYEVVGLRKDGTTFPIELHGKAIPYRGRLVRVTIIRDLTERKRLEEELRQAQKMEAVGRLAGGIAHDFNNLLTIIGGYSDLLLRRFDPGDPSRHQAEAIITAANHAAALTRQLLAFSRRQVLKPKVVDLNAVVTEIGCILRRLIGEDIELVTALDPVLGRVSADPGQLAQVLLNLVVNARDAMPQGGRLALETANVALDEADARPYVGVTPGRYVRLMVRDTGVGMDAATASHLFEPFFTTKEPGKGTGLGLATVYGIVTQSGGHLEVDSTPGRGTTFNIYLPRFEEAIEAVEPAAAPTKWRQGLETVLLVEDEARVQGVAREILRSTGYIVLAASDGDEALRIAVQHEGPIHLLLTDVVMPGMSGPELVSRLASLRPEMRVMYMSGHAIVHHGPLDPGVVLLEKPFTPETLVHKVREILERDLADRSSR